MAYILEVRKTSSIPDLFRDAARHSITEMENWSGVSNFKDARITIEPMPECNEFVTFTHPMRFQFGRFELLWMGEKTFDEKQYGYFYGTGRYQDKRSFMHSDWLEMDETDLMFECCQEFIKICESLRNSEIKPFDDDEVTEPWNEDDEENEEPTN